MEIELSSIGLTQTDLDDLYFIYFGVAISNPSSSQLLLANDEFSEAFGSGVEYDTIGIPEPSTAPLLGMGCAWLAFLRRRARRPRV